MPTQVDTNCPSCSGKPKRKTEHVALVKNETTGQEPHEYSVCGACYQRQFAVVYPGIKCPV